MGNTKEPEGYVEHLYTQDMTDAALAFQKNIESFCEAKRKVEEATTKLLSTWAGKGRNEFEVQYKLLFGQLGDIGDALYDIYEVLVDSEMAYYDADEEINKQLRLSVN